MPAPTNPVSDPRQPRPVLGHVNLMVDTFLANASADDLRAIVRGLLSTGTPAITTAFLGAAQRRLTQASPSTVPTHGELFVRRAADDASFKSTPELKSLLKRARTMYGAGLGFASLRILARPIKATATIRWHDSPTLEKVFAEIDADVSQALQSSREELESGRLDDIVTARSALEELKSAIRDSKRAIEGWGGVFPFERAMASIEFWKL